MKYFKFKKNKDHYKNGEVISTEKANKLLEEWIKDGTVEETKKPAVKKPEKD